MSEQMSVVQFIDRGTELEEQGLLDEALKCFNLALHQEPSQGRANFLKANVLVALGRFEEALASYDRALDIKPDSAGAHFNRGSVCERLGRLDEAERAIRTAVSLKSDFADAWVGLGNVLRAMGRQEEALASYFRALRLDTQYAEVHLNVASTCLALGKEDKAEQHFMQCVRMRPCYQEAYSAFAEYLVGANRADEAIVLLHDALSCLPNNLSLMESLAGTLMAVGRYGDSEAVFRDTLAISPEDSSALNGLGAVLSAGGRFLEAEDCFRRAVKSEGGAAGDASRNLAATLHAQRRYRDAISVYERLLSRCQDDSVALSNLALLRVEIGDIDEALDMFQKLERLSPDGERAIDALSHILFVRHYLNPSDFDKELKDERRFGAMVARPATRYGTWRCMRSTERVVRVGLVSADLRDHPVGFFVQSVLKEMWRRRPTRLEFYVYSNTYEFDDTSARIRESCAGWDVIRGISDAQAAKRIHDDHIDILVDLSGHSANHRLPVFAWKPAPLQVTWLGYFGTTGMSEIDYVIADPWTLPEGGESEFTETVWRLPETRLCFSVPNFDVTVSSLPALTNGFVTLGCFNNLPKINAEVVEIWSQILGRIPGARLMLKCKQFDDPWLQRETIERFSRHGVRPDQLVLEGSSSRNDYLASYSRVDIVLDPFPYPGGTTTVETLWMGVPVLSMNGSRFLSRQGGGLLANAGLPDWIATDAQDYVEKAVTFSGDLSMLARIRAGLRDRVLASPLFDAKRFAGHLEGALCEMWRRRCVRGDGLS